MMKLILLLVACCLCSVNAKINITYTLYSDSLCTNSVYSLEFPSGECTYDSNSGYSGIVSVAGDLVYDTYFTSDNCAGAGTEILFGRNACYSQGGSSWAMFTYTYEPVGTKEITYTRYIDTACTDEEYNLVFTEGECTNDPTSGYSAILLLLDDLATDNYFLAADCVGVATSISLANGVCQNDGSSSFKLAWSSSAILVPTQIGLMFAMILAFLW